MPTDTWWNLDQQKRDDILSAALAEFAAHHYDDASISALVKRVGIAKGSIYQYFVDKQDLYDYLLHFAHDTMHRAVVALMPQYLTPQADMFAIVRAYLHAVVQVSALHRPLAQLIDRSLTEDNDRTHTARALYDRFVTTYTTELVEGAVQDRSVRHDIPPTAMVLLLLHVMRGVMTHSAQRDDDPMIDALIVLLDQGLRYRIRQ